VRDIGRALAILPAAGASQRMGRAKLLLPYRDDTIVGSLVSTLECAGVRPVVLVLRPGAIDFRRFVRRRSLLAVLNPEPERGMLSSIQEGLRALGGAARLAELLVERRAPLLIMPADLPSVLPATVETLLERQAASDGGIVLPGYRGRRGHPLLVHPRLLATIETLEPAVGLRQIFERHPDDIETVPIDDPGVLRDVDTVEDYRRLER
jgi:CTP:molybdopterin cytidylyltransferase MocA